MTLTVKDDVRVMRKVYNDKGEVAVLYSPGFGAGWFTWNTENPDMLFDPTIVHFILDEEDAVERHNKITAYATLKYPDAYLGGADDLTVEWVSEGTLFKVNEYDGNESIEYKEDDQWMIA